MKVLVVHNRARHAASLAVLALVLGLAGPVGADHYDRTEEIPGENNIEVAVAFSQRVFPDGAEEALLARDNDFPDALASGLAQGSRPLLYTRTNELADRTLAELTRLRQLTGSLTVTILGGTNAVSAAVEQDLENRGFETERISGPTRVDTAVEVAQAHAPAATTALLAAAFAPQGATDPTRAFADSISAGGWAAAAGFPVLLTETAELSARTRAHLEGSSITRVNIVGGTAAVSENVAEAVRGLGIEVRRVSGSTRFHTAVAVASDRGFPNAGVASRVIILEGQAAHSWAAGFAAAALANTDQAPIVLVTGATVPEVTEAFLTHGSGTTELTCGPRMDAGACAQAAETMGQSPTVDALFAVLESAAIGSSTEDGQQVRFTFSRPLGSTVQVARFKLYAVDGQPVDAVAAGRSATEENVVIAVFPQAGAAEATIAGVARGAAVSLGGTPSAEGSAGLQAVTVDRDRGPQIVGVNLVGGNTATRGGDSEDWDYLVTYDRGVAVGDGSYWLVFDHLEEGEDDVYSPSHASTSPVAGRSDQLRVRFQVDADELEENQELSTSMVRRFIAGPDAVGGGAPQFASVTHLPRSTQTPDLTSVTPQSGSVRFTFSAAVEQPPSTPPSSPARFKVVTRDGQVHSGTSVASFPGNDSTNVDVRFPNAAMNNVIVGGFVERRAVRSTGLNELGLPSISGDRYYNAPDFRSRSASFSAGQSSAPQLVSVVFNESQVSGFTVRYLFDKPVSLTGAEGSFVVYDESGTDVIALSSCAVSQNNNARVDCSPASADEDDVKDAEFGAAQYRAVRNPGASADTETGNAPALRAITES